MTRARLLACVALVTMVACLPLTSRPSPKGSAVWVYAESDTVRGELLAVSADSLWVLEQSGSGAHTALPLSGLSRVRVQRGPGLTNFVARGVAFGIASGLGMYVACTTIGEGCGSVFIFSAAVPTMLSLFAGASVTAGRERSFTTRASFTADSLAPYARWPQGRPLSHQSTSTPDLPSVP